MKRKSGWYCRLCWQEFTEPIGHNAGAYAMVDGKEVRLNGVCAGTIADYRRITTPEKKGKSNEKRENQPAGRVYSR